ncbi:MAG: hypothetical protein IM671_07525 [Phenylobacterium sp.]|jgi:hypothetical protein|uniref:hypothetical protein n=1 Tax=Phenylobacterium sp. TaxID=1871053 RepID=UPI0025EFA2F9|nr:hypothetical protein [Phenylobacterium sp.]MCA3755950.1 hypothetical protein [Phenylobacterium sp.]MCA6246557.1 hypothetical protein [Phenylobacterium sp.]
MNPTFPAIGFRRDVGRYGTPDLEKFDEFLSAEDFAICDQWELKYGARNGMVLVDSNLNCWRVTNVKRLRIRRPLWSYLLRLLVQQALYWVDQDLEPLEPITLDQLKDRIAASILSNPDDWRDDEAIAGEDGPPQDEQELLYAIVAGVRAADSVEGIVDFL